MRYYLIGKIKIEHKYFQFIGSYPTEQDILSSIWNKPDYESLAILKYDILHDHLTIYNRYMTRVIREVTDHALVRLVNFLNID